MKELTLAHQAEFERYSKKTRREQFLQEMDAVMPWTELFALIAPHYSKGEAGRKPVGLEIMLRVYFLGSIALFVGEKGGGRCRSEEKSKSGTFPPRLEIPQELRDFHFSHHPCGDYDESRC